MLSVRTAAVANGSSLFIVKEEESMDYLGEAAPPAITSPMISRESFSHLQICNK